MSTADVLSAGLALHERLSTTGWWVFGIGAAVVLLAVAVALLKQNPSDRLKKMLFGVIAVASVSTTFGLIGLSIYKTGASVTGGPVHWHADFLIYDACGEEVDLVDPRGLVNRIGTPVLHEHGDSRIHVEGEVIALEDVSLGSFFTVIGGSFTAEQLTVPTNNGSTATLYSGQRCNSYSGEKILQTFVYTVDADAKTLTQKKLADPVNYVLSPERSVPPGDCVVIELSEEKAATEYLCPFHQIAVNKGELTLTE